MDKFGNRAIPHALMCGWGFTPWPTIFFSAAKIGWPNSAIGISRNDDAAGARAKALRTAPIHISHARSRQVIHIIHGVR